MAVEKVFNEIFIEITDKAKAFNLALDDTDCNYELQMVDNQIKELEREKNRIIEKYTNYYLVKLMKES